MFRLRRTPEQRLNAILDEARAAEIEIEEATSLLALGRTVDVRKLIETSRELLRLLDRQRLLNQEAMEELRAEAEEFDKSYREERDRVFDLEKQLDEETTRANNAEDELAALKEQQQPAPKKSRKKS